MKVHDDFKLQVNCPIILNNDCIPEIIDDHLNEVIDGIEIAECVTISSNDCENYLNNELHEKQYEANILKRANFTCESCEKFLFEDQIHFLKKNVTLSLADETFKKNLSLCSYCHNRIANQEIPSISVKYNNLCVEPIPYVLNCLTNIERK